MNTTEAMRRANMIAKLLHVGSEILAATPMEKLGLFGRLSISTAAQAHDAEALNPRISDIILFGSLARNEEEVNDVDLLVFEHGFYSGILMNEIGSSYEYGLRKTTLFKMMTYWFGFPEGEYTENEIKAVSTTLVDLLVLPVKFFSDKNIQSGIASRQKDPRFFTNVFRNMMRFDPGKSRFEAYSIEDLEKKYGVDLSRFVGTINVN